MSSEGTFRRYSLALEPQGDGMLDAGTVRALLTDVVECHPRDQAHLWGRGITNGTVPPSARLHVGTEHITLTWDSGDLAAYDAAYEAEKQKRDNLQAQDTPAVVDSGAVD